MLFRLLRQSIGFSMTASLMNLLATFVVVRFAGPVAYADYTVDIYKMALLVLILEVVPSPYATFQSQRDPALARHLASFALVSSVLCVVLWAGVATLGFFSQPSLWMAAYAFYLGVQRYIDIRLQATNRITILYRLLAWAAGLRLVFLVVGLVTTRISQIDVLWASLAIGSLVPPLAWAMFRPDVLKPFLRTDHLGSLIELATGRRNYIGYYANTGLKRLRDSFMPIAASVLVADKVELARYLLAMRGVEAATGQLRIAEALLANLGNRAAIAANRQQQLLLLALLAGGATFTLSFVLIAQIDLSWMGVIQSLCAALFVFPYVFELAYRSDAYAAHRPSRVTFSLVAFIGTLAVSLSALYFLDHLIATALILTHVLAQVTASLSYRVIANTRHSDDETPQKPCP